MDVSEVAIALTCASADVATLEPIARALRSDGRSVVLIDGLQREPRNLSAGIEACGHNGLIVVAESANLDGPAIRRVEGVFAVRRGPEHVLVRLDLSLPQAALIHCIRQAARSIDIGEKRRPPLRHTQTGSHVALREFVTRELSGMSMPVVRLAPEEVLEGDTDRIQLADNPFSAERIRQHRAADADTRETRPSIAASPRAERAARAKVPVPVRPSPHGDDTGPIQVLPSTDPLERTMVLTMVAIGVMAVLTALFW